MNIGLILYCKGIYYFQEEKVIGEVMGVWIAWLRRRIRIDVIILIKKRGCIKSKWKALRV